jgi:hypothetical protein
MLTLFGWRFGLRCFVCVVFHKCGWFLSRLAAIRCIGGSVCAVAGRATQRRRTARRADGPLQHRLVPWSCNSRRSMLVPLLCARACCANARRQAATRLQMQSPGTFLVRCSASSGVGYWTISFVREEDDGSHAVAHRRVEHAPHGFLLENANALLSPGLRGSATGQLSDAVDHDANDLVGVHPQLTSVCFFCLFVCLLLSMLLVIIIIIIWSHNLSLSQLILAAAPILGLTTPCPGSPFLGFFAQSGHRDKVLLVFVSIARFLVFKFFLLIYRDTIKLWFLNKRLAKQCLSKILEYGNCMIHVWLGTMQVIAVRSFPIDIWRPSEHNNDIDHDEL